MDKNLRKIALIVLIALLGVSFFVFNNEGGSNVFNLNKVEKIQYSVFLQKVKSGNINKITIKNSGDIVGSYSKGDKAQQFETVIPYDDPQLVKLLTKYNIEFDGESSESGFLQYFLLNGGLLFILLIFFWIVMARQMGGGGGGSKAMSFGKSKAKLHPETKNKVTFKDVAGVEEAKVELAEIIDFLKDPKKFINIGAKIPTGVLLMGPPGTGKTLLARAIAGEAGVPFFSISGSDFVEMFVGVGASRVRDLFEQGKKNAPCIIFIDEIDAVGRLRGAGLGGGHDEREQTLNQLLVEMDGFEKNEGVIIVAATNRPDVLDPALLRPGRFDRQVVVDSPDVRGREKILAVHSRKIPLERDVDLKILAQGTPGFTGADLANLINEGALLAARKDKKRVAMAELESAKDKVLMGPERKSMVLSDEDKEIIASHEAGHAVLGMVLPSEEVVHKVTIIPRGRALGVTMSLPKEDKHLHPRQYWVNQIIKLFGGHVAEKIVFGDVTTGASNDIERATDIARRMVCEWGMSKKLGPISFAKENDQVFLGREISQHKDFSDKTAETIDSEVNEIIAYSAQRAEELIIENRVMFDRIANALIERETIGDPEIEAILNGEPLPAIVETEDDLDDNEKKVEEKSGEKEETVETADETTEEK